MMTLDDPVAINEKPFVVDVDLSKLKESHVVALPLEDMLAQAEIAKQENEKAALEPPKVYKPVVVLEEPVRPTPVKAAPAAVAAEAPKPAIVAAEAPKPAIVAAEAPKPVAAVAEPPKPTVSAVKLPPPIVGTVSKRASMVVPIQQQPVFAAAAPVLPDIDNSHHAGKRFISPVPMSTRDQERIASSASFATNQSTPRKQPSGQTLSFSAGNSASLKGNIEANWTAYSDDSQSTVYKNSSPQHNTRELVFDDEDEFNDEFFQSMPGQGPAHAHAPVHDKRFVAPSPLSSTSQAYQSQPKVANYKFVKPPPKQVSKQDAHDALNAFLNSSAAVSGTSSAGNLSSALKQPRNNSAEESAGSEHHNNLLVLSSRKGAVVERTPDHVEEDDEYGALQDLPLSVSRSGTFSRSSPSNNVSASGNSANIYELFFKAKGKGAAAGQPTPRRVDYSVTTNFLVCSCFKFVFFFFKKKRPWSPRAQMALSTICAS